MNLDLKRKAAEIRAQIIELCTRAKTPHLASQLSCVDILVAAYFKTLRIDPQNPTDFNRDRFIFSKGHAVPALYITLAERAFFDKSLLDLYAQDGARLGEQPSPGCAPGVELATGSLGHGLGVGLGMALAGKLQNAAFRVYALLSDGECNEGSVWEAALFAAAQKLSQVCVIVDFNKWQATGRSTEVMALNPFADKWRSFGWSAYEVDGHDIDAVSGLLQNIPDGSGKPVAIIAHTIKGKGVSFMEDDNNWHYLIPKPEHLEKAKKELGIA